LISRWFRAGTCSPRAPVYQRRISSGVWRGGYV
jgi:hypothetical protein